MSTRSDEYEASRGEWSLFNRWLLFLIVGCPVYYWLEGWSLTTTIYFLTVSCTTVGYGDIHPVTAAGKAFTIGYALFGTTLIFSALAPVIDRFQTLIDKAEDAATGFLERHGLLAPAIDALDLSLSVEAVNEQTNYARHYMLSLVNPIIVFAIGLVIAATVVVPGGGVVDQAYWVFISMSTIG